MSTESTTRYFKVSDPKINKGEYFGSFTGKTPKQAANKAFSSIIKTRTEEKISTRGKITFMIKETTRGSNDKVRSYVGERKKLDPPTTVMINGKPVVYHFENIVKAAGVVE